MKDKYTIERKKQIKGQKLFPLPVEICATNIIYVITRK